MARLRAALITALTITALTAGTALAAPPVIDQETLPNGNLGAEYSAFLTAQGGEGDGPLEFRVVEGKLPSGLKLFRSFGVQSALIFGTPTREGTFTFTVRVEDPAGNTDTQVFTITIDPPEPLVINNPSPTLREGFVGEPYAANLFAIGGIQPYRWAIVAGALPDGLRLKDNVISGTPETAGTFVFTARVTDKAGTTAEQEFTIIVS
ncbi:MAG TPA: Ig domain-containing protein [Candidatus Limnocylindrales bacterium]|nr:Ig domain-containing protein [Candidatus Limnocylindrales bacterium]